MEESTVEAVSDSVTYEADPDENLSDTENESIVLKLDESFCADPETKDSLNGDIQDTSGEFQGEADTSGDLAHNESEDALNFIDAEIAEEHTESDMPLEIAEDTDEEVAIKREYEDENGFEKSGDLSLDFVDTSCANGTLDSSAALSDSGPKPSLPECRTKRSYVCSHCGARTVNPREHLYHLNDVHGEGLRIFECELCMYASKSFQKLIRHTEMVHKKKSTDSLANKLVKKPMVTIPAKTLQSTLPHMRYQRESKSPRRFEEYEFTDDMDDFDEPLPAYTHHEEQKKVTVTLKCDSCGFTTHSSKIMNKHQTKCQSKKELYKCPQCKYATPVKSRLKNHIKYHNLAVVKCEFCDFQTPYRWNLDRHMKNHLGQRGDFQCHLCNFRALIKQSLTVHVTNHHHGSHIAKTGKANTQEDEIDDEEMELLRMERDEDLDALEFTPQSFAVTNTASASHTENQHPTDRKKPKIKMTFKKMKRSHSRDDEATGVDPEDIVQMNGNVYLKTEKCNVCSFKAAFPNEIAAHMLQEHGVSSTDIKEELPNGLTDEEMEEPMDEANDANDSSPKKKPSFFDKLQEKISTTNVENLVCQFCSHQSKCLSEAVRHQKLHLSANNSSTKTTFSSRCQFCRQRCKSSDDLMNHLKSCTVARKNQISANEKDSSATKDDEDAKHPMENRVFVWNNLDQYEAETSPPSASTGSKVSLDQSDLGVDAERKMKNQYQCPHCNFNTVTPSRFHAHKVGHDNRRPYSCSDCGYASNWRWDITKHIRLKLTRKDSHKGAEVIVSAVLKDTSYEKYDKFIVSIPIERKRNSKDFTPAIKKLKRKHSKSPAAASVKIPAPPKLMRAPTRNPSQNLNASPAKHSVDINSNSSYTKPPPLVAMGAASQAQPEALTDESDSAPEDDKTKYEIMTQQGAMNTNLETLQMLASDSSKLDLLKILQKKSEDEPDTPDSQAFSQQMRMLLWLNCLTREAENKTTDNESATAATDIMQLMVDHEGNPEWKCASCDFRDHDQETVTQHVQLAHSKKGPVSLVHAVHKCSVCAYAAGTKRHVMLHIENSHNGHGDVISKSEGQNLDADNRSDEGKTYRCRQCPFTSKKKQDLRHHTSFHTPRIGFVFKCYNCEFYVQTKEELFSHLTVHGVSPTENGGLTPDSNSFTMSQDDSSPRPFYCGLCPFESHSRPKLMHHRQFHRPRGLPYRCSLCSYNVTRRHLLQQHLKSHGITEEVPVEPVRNGDDASSNSPSPCLTITPISTKEPPKPSINPALLPTLSDELTKNLKDIPLVWVSKEKKFSKMFKCRHCPHVNLRKTNIQEHEKMHIQDSLPPGVGHSCQLCSYVSVNAGILTSHMKTHSGLAGKCHAIVDHALPNEEQLHMLAGSYTQPEVPVKTSDEKLIYYCQHCPGRFFYEKEVMIHSRFHSAKFPHQCDKCSYNVRDPQQLLSHTKVHTPEFQERTRTLMTMHPSAPTHPPTAGNTLPADVLKDVMSNANASTPQNDCLSMKGVSGATGSEQSDMRQPPPTSKFKCDKCPSSFSKLVTLQYHQSLHSSNHPFKCNRCSYAAKTQLGLDQHLALHVQAELEQVAAATARTPSPPQPRSSNSIQETLNLMSGSKKRPRSPSLDASTDHPPIKMKFSLKGDSTKKQFNYYIEENVPLSGIDLLKRKNQIERELPKESVKTPTPEKTKAKSKAEDRVGNPAYYYPMHIDKSSGKTKQKRYKCVKCPSAFEKLDQFNVHINLHGSDYRFKCRMCDYTVKFYANFMMHIKRHKYHERMDAQTKGITIPDDEDPRFQPIVGENSAIAKEKSKEELPAKENKWEAEVTPDMTTSEKQHLLLQEKKGDTLKCKEEDPDKKIFYCQYCPYANTRRDGVDSHSLRHTRNNGRGVYSCNFCDYTASQPNFIREHTKVHFRPFKYVTPEGFMRHDKFEIWSICSTEEDGSTSKKLAVSHEDSKFEPGIQVKLTVQLAEGESQDDVLLDDGISVDHRTADLFDAPSHMK